MSKKNHIYHLLKHWYSNKDNQQWVLAVIVETQGPSYRKAGAMMLINELGQYFGLLSGGCLEADIVLAARKVLETGCARIEHYDFNEQESGWQGAVGCGGEVRILLESIHADNDYLHLEEVFDSLCRHQSVDYALNYAVNPTRVEGVEVLAVENKVSRAIRADVAEKLLVRMTPPVRLLVIGGGNDVQPLVEMASKNLGWLVWLADPRSGYAKAREFDSDVNIKRCEIAELQHDPDMASIDAAVVMTHNLRLDAQAIQLLQAFSPTYIGLLGSLSRIEKVSALCDMSVEALLSSVNSPVGLDIGAELPETIALSILAECQAALAGGSSRSLKDVAQP